MGLLGISSWNISRSADCLGSKDTAETLLGEELVEIVWEGTRGTSSHRGTSSAEEMGDEAGVRDGVGA